MTFEEQLQQRIRDLERELRTRPTKQQIAYVQEFADRRERLYEAVLKRNEILRRKLAEASS